MATVTTPISLDEALLQRISRRASEQELSLSRLIALAAERYLAASGPKVAEGRRERQRALLSEIDAAWADGLDPEERTVMRGMQRKYRQAVKDRW